MAPICPKRRRPVRHMTQHPASLMQWERSFPLSHAWYRTIVEAHSTGCSANMLEIAVLCCSKKPIVTEDKDISFWEREADVKAHSHDGQRSDHITQMQLLQMYMVAHDTHEDAAQLDSWCHARSLDRQALDEAVREVAALKSWLAANPRMTPLYYAETPKTPVLRVLVRVFSSRLAIGCLPRGQGLFQTVPDNEAARISPSSVSRNHYTTWVL